MLGIVRNVVRKALFRNEDGPDGQAAENQRCASDATSFTCSFAAVVAAYLGVSEPGGLQSRAG